jgi:GTPase SAR1 family protein
MFLIRLLIVGETNVGKTSLLLRFHENQFTAHQKTTIGVDYKAKEVQLENEMVKIQVVFNRRLKMHIVDSLTLCLML